MTRSQRRGFFARIATVLPRTSPGADMLYGLVAGFVEGHYRVLAQDDPTALRQATSSYSKLYNESCFAASAMRTESPQFAAPKSSTIGFGFEPRVKCAAC